MQVSF